MDLRAFITSIITNILTPAIWLILSLAIVYFLWNIMQIIRKSDEPDTLEKLKSQATWGVVAIFVMVSLWGLVNILIRTFRPSTQLEYLPQLPAGGGSGQGSFGAPRAAAPASSQVSGGPTASSPSFYQTFFGSNQPQQSVAPSSQPTSPYFQTPQQSTIPGR